MHDLKCSICGQTFTPSKAKWDAWRQRGRVGCSPECSAKNKSRVSSETMARTNRQYASARMTARNPMKRPEIRAKVSESLREMGWKPQVRRGNGFLTRQQQALSTALGWSMELAIATKMPRSSGYPTCYKMDVGNRDLKIAIEINGPSHQALVRQAQDAKKAAFLRALGWTVLSFSNREIDADLARCVQMVWSTTSKLGASTPTRPMA